MIRIPGRAVVYGELWYDEGPPRHAGVDVVVHRQLDAPLLDARSTPSLTMYSDLSAPADAILREFSDTCRYQIRRADGKDGLELEVVVDPEGKIDEFCDFYDAFARQKSIWLADRRWLESASRAGQIILTAALRGGEALVRHAHLVCGTTARLAYSGSLFRGADQEYRALVGRANRWLHWRDMLLLKESGIGRYDWGGLFDDESAPERAGINRFKRSFGGRETRTYDCTVPVTLRGRVWLPVRDAWHRFRVSP